MSPFYFSQAETRTKTPLTFFTTFVPYFTGVVSFVDLDVLEQQIDFANH